MRENIPHMKGTLVIGSGTGGGFQTPNEGDMCVAPHPCSYRMTLSRTNFAKRLPTLCRYEGEFEAGYAHGLGQYISSKGEIYRGEFKKGQRNGSAGAALP